MPDTLSQLLPYLPPGLARAYLSAPAAAWPAPPAYERLPAAVLFADVSGFTSLTEALARRGAEGPEELTLLLNRYFGSMIAEIEAEGGEVAEFSGDALTVLFPARDEPLGHAVRRAAQAGAALQRAMAGFAVTQTSAGPISLSLKIGVGAGEVGIFLVGGTFGRWECVVAGEPLAQVALAEHQARPGDLLLSPEAAALIWPAPLAPRPLPALAPPARGAQAMAEALRGFVPAAVRRWLSAGLHEWAAVLRPMSVLFCGVGGLDYAAPDALGQLQGFLSAVQATIYTYEGSINKLVVDDKGTVLLALFGAPPLAHEDDPARALRCALDLQAAAAAQGLRMAIGVTTGLVFAGPVGGPTRREYTVMGDPVNLAARLMALAGAGEVRCDGPTAAAARAALACEALPPARLKGKAEPVPVFRPLGRASPAARGAGDLVGRDAELARVAALVAEVRAGASRALLLRGEAGIGKSRLLAELRALLAGHGLLALEGAGVSTERESPYRAWRPIVAQALGLDPEAGPEECRRRLRALAAEAPALAERLPLLNAVLPAELPETDLTAPLSGAARHELRISLLIELLRRQAAPLALLLDDAHWLDSLSWELALALARATAAAHAPLLLVVAMRPLDPEDTPAALADLAQLPACERLTLAPLDDDATLALAAARLGVAPAALPPELAALVQGHAEGNPLFAEELALALRDRGLIAVRPGPPPAVSLEVAPEQLGRALPLSIQGIALARIDRLPPEEQLTLRVGAVIGRRFAFPPLLAALTPLLLPERDALLAWLLALVRHDLTLPDATGGDLRYLFKHSVTRDVAYASLLFTQRRRLHRAVAEWYEQVYGAASLAPYAALLAYHWGQAEDPEREIVYLRLAGEQAFQSHALPEARRFFGLALERLRRLPAPDPAAEGELTRQLGNALWYAGDLDAAAATLQESVGLARAAGDRAALAETLCYLGRVHTEIGAYPAARAALDEARALAQASHDDANLLIALRYLGIVAMYQGEEAAAQAIFGHGLELARARGDRLAEANILISLGYLAAAADIPAAEGHYRASLDLAAALGHRWHMAITLANLGELAARRGDYAAAQELARQSLAIDRTIGNRHGVAATLSNLGEAACAQGRYAEAAGHFREALALTSGIGDTLNLLYGLQGIARLQISLGAKADAAALLALVLAHPACDEDLRLQARQQLDALGPAPRPPAEPQAQLAGAVAAAEGWLAGLSQTGQEN